VTSYSVSLSVTSGWNTGGYGFEGYFSTYDGNTNAYPQGLSNSQISSELMPSTPGSGSYLTDFAIYSTTYGVYYKRGTMTVTMPTTDSDANGCPDALQVNKSFSNTASVSSTEYNSNDGGYTWFYYGIFNYSFTFSRSLGSSLGSFTGSGYDPTSRTTSTFSGSYNVEGGTGNATYNPTTKAITFAGNSFSFGTSGSGTSTFTRISDNQVSVAQFNFYTSDGYTRTVKAFTLNRTGNYYRAYPVELVDGDPSTSFVDFRYCHVEILDTNDTDGDWTPDLSDANSKRNQTITFNALASKTYGASSFSLTGTASSGLPLSYTSSNTSVATVSGSVVTIVGPGSSTITASQAGNTSYNSATSVSQTLTVTVAAPVVSSAATASGKVGTAFSYQIAASGTPTSYSATGLPAGLTVNTATGLISGTPTVAATTAVTLRATNTAGTGTKSLTITVTVAAPVVSSVATASGKIGTAFSYQITASGTPTSYSATGLPAGLTVNTATGLISGTPTTAATTAVTVGAINGGGTGTKALTITVTVAAPVVSSAATASGKIGTAFSYQITATGGATSYSATGLPAGLTVNTVTGLISGTPTTAATSAVTLRATNTAGTGTKALTITVAAR